MDIFHNLKLSFTNGKFSLIKIHYNYEKKNKSKLILNSNLYHFKIVQIEVIDVNFLVKFFV